ncbi:MAG: dipeptidase [Ardenticatenaceae bacterium]|nr:dipeptidase [Ardenticatenaceae bacterium]
MNPLTYAQQQQAQHLQELIEFLRLPSISTQEKHNEDVAETAVWLANNMTQAGIENVRVIKTQRHPLVYGDWLHAGSDAPTALIYGHYDVQPVDPIELWDSAPFEPDIRDNYLYARGASDDKGQTFLHVKAVEAYLKTEGKLPINVKFIIEGEEESGGESLRAFIPANKELLTANVAVVSDTGMPSPQQPAITYGLRGNCYVLMDITGPARDLHSGSFGGGIDNPLNVLGHLIASFKDQEGHILIPGFYDDVRPLSDEERALLAQFPMDEAAWLADTGAPQTWGEPEYTLVERIGARPTLDVHGIIGGYTGPGGKTVLPSTVHVKLSMRLVPNQDPADILAKFKAHVLAVAPPTVSIVFHQRGGAPASVCNLNHPAMKAAAAAFTAVFENPPVFMREGGSIPVVGQFQQYLGLETVLMGFGLPSDNLHAPNERFYLPNFYRGIETSIRFLAEYGRL